MKNNRWINFTVLFVLIFGSFGMRSSSNHLAVAAPLADEVLYVKPESDGAEDCTSWDDACELQDALETALYGDQIWAASGIYTPTHRTDSEDPLSATFEMKSGVGIYGGFVGSESELAERDWETNITVLSGDLEGNDITDPSGVITDTINIIGSNVYHVVSSEGVTETAILDGFNITGGAADGEDPLLCYEKCGGGMYNVSSSPVLSNVIFRGNTAFRGGGGMYNEFSSPGLFNVTFSGNMSDNDGGGIYNLWSAPELSYVTLSGNIANLSGGGMDSHYSDPVLNNVIFDGNKAEYGAGMRNLYGSQLLSNVNFRSNTADVNGGGIDNAHNSLVMTNVAFDGNLADYYGGGMDNYNNLIELTNVTFSGNLAGMDGGGMFNWTSRPVVMTGVTFSGNHADSRGGGMYNISSPIITNTILWGNTAEEGGHQIYNSDSSFPSISYSDIQGGCETIVGNDCSGGGNIDVNPRVLRNPDPGTDGIWGTADDDYGNLRLRPDSPAIDAGDNFAVPEIVNSDMDGNPRFTDILGIPDSGNGTPPIVDIGAYEATFRLVYLPLITH